MSIFIPAILPILILEENLSKEVDFIDISGLPEEPAVEILSPARTPEIPTHSVPTLDLTSPDSVKIQSDENLFSANGNVSVDSSADQNDSLDLNGNTGGEVTDVPPETLSVTPAIDVGVNGHSDLSSGTTTEDTVEAVPTKLPSLEAFSAGIQPYEPFKNLPDSQGSYDRVRNVLKRIRSGDVSFSSEEAHSTPTKSTVESSSSQRRSLSSARSSTKDNDDSSRSSKERRKSPPSSERKASNSNGTASTSRSSYRHHESSSRHSYHHRHESSRTSHDRDYRSYQSSASRRDERRGNYGSPYRLPLPPPPPSSRSYSDYGRSRDPYPRGPPPYGYQSTYAPSRYGRY